MRYKHYLTEGRRSKKILLPETMYELKTNCKQAVKSYNKGDVIYRGVSSTLDYLKVNPKYIIPRTSANTKNYYTLLNDNSPEWKDYPKRSESIICTTDINYANNYGENVYAVFPYDGSKIGICSKKDYWFSFDKVNKLHITNMNRFNASLFYLFDQVDIKLSDSDYNDIQKSFKLFDKQFKDDKKSIDNLIKDNGFGILNNYNKHKDLMKTIQEVLKPKENGFKVITIGEDIPSGNHEVWTDGMSILIYYMMAEDIIKQL